MLFLTVNIFGQSTNSVCSSAAAASQTGACVGGAILSTDADNVANDAGCATTGGQNNHRDVWYTFVSTGNTFDFNFTGGTLGTGELILASGSCTALTLVNSSCGALPLTGTFTGLVSGTTYYIIISSPNNNFGTFTLCTTVSTATCLVATQIPAQYPSTTFTPSCIGSETITTCGYASEYSIINVIAGVTYTFASSIGTDNITISNSAGTSALTVGTGSVVWTSTVTGTIRFYTHTAGCGAQATCRTKTAGCGSVPPPSGNQNCTTSTQVCSNASFTGNSSGFGTQELPNNGTIDGCLTIEHQSSWYIFQAVTSGTVSLTITTAVDYDFAIWGPNVSCGALGTPVRCSFSGLFGNTGLGNTATDFSDGDGTGGNGGLDAWVRPLTVTAGQTYIMLIDNFTANSTAFTLNWTMAGGATLNCTPLPIELLYFNVEMNSCTENILTWSTATELNNKTFELERSNDGMNFHKITEINGAGNSTSVLKYKYSDMNLELGINYYRLKQVDYDGQFKYTNLISVDNSCGGKAKIVRITNLIGQEVGDEYEGTKIIQYNDGSVVRKFGFK